MMVKWETKNHASFPGCIVNFWRWSHLCHFSYVVSWGSRGEKQMMPLSSAVLDWYVSHMWRTLPCVWYDFWIIRIIDKFYSTAHRYWTTGGVIPCMSFYTPGTTLLALWFCQLLELCNISVNNKICAISW